MRVLSAAIVLAGLGACTAGAETPDAADSQQARAPAPPSGEFTIITTRRASDVAGGTIEGQAGERIGENISFGETLTWWDGTECKDWSAEPHGQRVLPLDDPNLSDTQLPPVDGPVSARDRRLNRGWSLTCEGEALGVLLQVDRRVLVIPTKSGVTNVIAEKPLSPDETLAVQKQLESMKFYSGEPSQEWDENSLGAVASYAEYRGAEFRFARPAITENLLDGLKIIAEGNAVPTEKEAAPARPVSADRSPSIKDRFPDYKPKETPDTLTDYRPSLADEVAALPAAEPDNISKLIDALVKWSRQADKNPGVWEDGNIALGANPKQYVPSDPELMVSEICERIRHIVLHTDAKVLGDALKAQNIKARKIVYKRFTFRHVDVMGSGRFFYASAPQQAIIKIRTAPE
ncbi:MAG: hypothetical protein ACLFWF_12730 [Alphaproteobacteria bacterium]